MSTRVYLIGHGRVDGMNSEVVPGNIVMHWLVPLGEISGGLSTNFLSGDLKEKKEEDETGRKTPGTSIPTSTPGTQLPPHYLCADLPTQNEPKIELFKTKNPNWSKISGKVCLIYSKEKINVSLQSIWKLLGRAIPNEQWDVYWLCCRSFTGEVKHLKTQLENGRLERIFRFDAKYYHQGQVLPPCVTEAAQRLDAQGHKTEQASSSNLEIVGNTELTNKIMLAGSSWREAPVYSKKGVDHSRKLSF